MHSLSKPFLSNATIESRWFIHVEMQLGIVKNAYVDEVLENGKCLVKIKIPREQLN